MKYDFIMKYYRCVFILLELYLNVLVSGKVPEYLKLCSKDGNLNQCLADNCKSVIGAISNGDASLKLQPLNKIHVERLPLQAAKDLQFTLVDLDYLGIENTILKEVNMDDKELRIKAVIPYLQIIGGYEVHGRILAMPLEGAGTCNLTNVGLSFEYKARLKTKERRGKTYYYVDDNFDDTEINNLSVERIYFQLSNLGSDINTFLNENWIDIYEEIQTTIKLEVGFIIMNPVINAFLRHIPIDELFV